MAGTAVPSYGTIVKKATNAQANITGVSFGGIQRDVIDATDLTDTWKQKILGAADGGTVEFQINVSEALVTAFMPDPSGTGSAAFEVDFPAPLGKFGFTGLIQSFTVEGSNGNAVTGSVTIEITGAVTYTVSA